MSTADCSDCTIHLAIIDFVLRAWLWELGLELSLSVNINEEQFQVSLIINT